MEYYNDKLKQLKEQVAKKTRLTNKVKEMRKQLEQLEEKVHDLGQERLSEEADVVRLESRSLANFFYSIVGKKDDMLTKEKEEAYAARVKYDAALSEMNALRADIRSVEAELGELYGCEKKYEQLIEEKRSAIEASGNSAAEELLKLEEQLLSLEQNEKEIKEAISAGNSALFTAEMILKSLDSAEGWGTWDLLGGGLISDIAKHSHLDEAQDKVEKLQIQLSRFKTELSDITIQSDMQVNVDGFVRFADYFFDGLFADWTVLSRIEKSKEQISGTYQQIKTAIRQLEGLKSTNARNQTAIKAQIDRAILNAEV